MWAIFKMAAFRKNNTNKHQSLGIKTAVHQSPRLYRGIQKAVHPFMLNNFEHLLLGSGGTTI